MGREEVCISLLIFAIAAGICNAEPYDETMIYGNFPDGFKWGAATAAYQVS